MRKASSSGAAHTLFVGFETCASKNATFSTRRANGNGEMQACEQVCRLQGRAHLDWWEDEAAKSFEKSAVQFARSWGADLSAAHGLPPSI